MVKWNHIAAAVTAAGTSGAAMASTASVPHFGSAASGDIVALPVASAIGLGLLIGAITVAGLIFFWRNRR